MNKRVRVNIRTQANTAAVRKEKRNGRDVLVVLSATLPDDVVMNEIQYPSDEIAASFESLNRTPAPAGHPTINGKFVSALDPEMNNIFGIGAWNENARRENGRVLLDKVIDVQRANSSEAGKAILSAIDKGEPVHTSTGLYCDLEAVNGSDHKFVARNIMFDHDAILLDEPGAATPEQGVGMMVNAKGVSEDIEVINSVLEDAERQLEWAADMAIRAVDQMERASIVDRLKSAIMEALRGSDEREPSAIKGEADMADEKQLNELSAKVNAIEESIKGLGDTIKDAVANAVKPLSDHVEEIQNAAKAKDEAEMADLVTKVVKANILTEDAAKGLTLNALRELGKKADPKPAAALNSAFGGTSTADEWEGYDLNAKIKKEAV